MVHVCLVNDFHFGHAPVVGCGIPGVGSVFWLFEILGTQPLFETGGSWCAAPDWQIWPGTVIAILTGVRSGVSLVLI